jgi:hypothetical protein
MASCGCIGCAQAKANCIQDACYAGAISTPAWCVRRAQHLRRAQCALCMLPTYHVCSLLTCRNLVESTCNLHTMYTSFRLVYFMLTTHCTACGLLAALSDMAYRLVYRQCIQRQATNHHQHPGRGLMRCPGQHNGFLQPPTYFQHEGKGWQQEDSSSRWRRVLL